MRAGQVVVQDLTDLRNGLQQLQRSVSSLSAAVDRLSAARNQYGPARPHATSDHLPPHAYSAAYSGGLPAVRAPTPWLALLALAGAINFSLLMMTAFKVKLRCTSSSMAWVELYAVECTTRDCDCGGRFKYVRPASLA